MPRMRLPVLTSAWLEQCVDNTIKNAGDNDLHMHDIPGKHGLQANPVKERPTQANSASEVMGRELSLTMKTAKAMSLMERDIEKAFELAGEDETRAAYVLSLMRLEPIEQRLFDRYKIRTGDGRLKFPPMAVIKSILLKELKSHLSVFQE